MLIVISKENIETDELITKAVDIYCELFNKSITAYKIIRKPLQKPSLEPRFLEFSVSHSGDYKIIAMSEEKVGIDIEKCKQLNWQEIAKRFFHQSEHCTTLEEFYKLWTAKEAYTKLEESDIIVSLQSSVIDKDIEYLNILENYTVAIASKDKDIIIVFNNKN